MTRPYHLITILFITVLSISIYANTLKNGFVYDDDSTVVNNTLIKNLDNLHKLFQKDYFSLSGEASYRPVVTFTYFIDYSIYGLKPWGFHLTNTLLHAANGILLYIFLTLLTKQSAVGSRWAEAGAAHHTVAGKSSSFNLQPLISTLLFITHPVLTEAVNAISFREDLLVSLFCIASLNIYLYLTTPHITPFPLRGDETEEVAGMKLAPMLYLVSCVLYFLALLSKEMAATLPLIILCYEWIYRSGKENKIRSILFNPYNIGYIAVTIFYLYLRFYYFYNPDEEHFVSWRLQERLFTVPYLLLNYIKITLLPVNLSADYVIKPVISIFSYSFIWPFIAVVLLLAVNFIMRKKKEFIFGNLFFITVLMPVYNIIPIANPFAERYLYFPVMGFIIVSGVFINTIGTRNKKLLYISSLLILCVFAFAVVERNRVWRDGYSLWTDTVKKTPDSSTAHYSLGIVHNDLGMVYDKLGRIDDAVLEYKEALRFNPDYLVAHNNLGIVYARQGRLNEAIEEFQTNLRLKPDYVKGHYNLGNAYYTSGRIEDAVLEYKEALRLKPDYADVCFSLGIAYRKKGLMEEARRAFENALRLNPNDAEARQALESLR